MEFLATDVMHISSLGFVAVAVTPDLPALAPGSELPVQVIRPDGSIIDASAIVEYQKLPPFKPVLLRFSGLVPTEIPLGSQILVNQPTEGDG